MKFRSQKMQKSSHRKILESASLNQHGNPVIQHLVTSPAYADLFFSRAWSVHASQINPERDKVANFGENWFCPNRNFYRLRYEQLFHFGELAPTHLSLHTNIAEDELEYQTYLQRVLAEYSVSVVRKDARHQSCDALDWCMEPKKWSRFSNLIAARSCLKFSFQRESRILYYRG